MGRGWRPTHFQATFSALHFATDAISACATAASAANAAYSDGSFADVSRGPSDGLFADRSRDHAIADATHTTTAAATAAAAAAALSRGQLSNRDADTNTMPDIAHQSIGPNTP